MASTIGQSGEACQSAELRVGCPCCGAASRVPARFCYRCGESVGWGYPARSGLSGTRLVRGESRAWSNSVEAGAVLSGRIRGAWGASLGGPRTAAVLLRHERGLLWLAVELDAGGRAQPKWGLSPGSARRVGAPGQELSGACPLVLQNVVVASMGDGLWGLDLADPRCEPVELWRSPTGWRTSSVVLWGGPREASDGRLLVLGERGSGTGAQRCLWSLRPPREASGLIPLKGGAWDDVRSYDLADPSPLGQTILAGEACGELSTLATASGEPVLALPTSRGGWLSEPARDLTADGHWHGSWCTPADRLLGLEQTRLEPTAACMLRGDGAGEAWTPWDHAADQPAEPVARSLVLPGQVASQRHWFRLEPLGGGQAGWLAMTDVQGMGVGSTGGRLCAVQEAGGSAGGGLGSEDRLIRPLDELGMFNAFERPLRVPGTQGLVWWGRWRDAVAAVTQEGEGLNLMVQRAEQLPQTLGLGEGRLVAPPVEVGDALVSVRESPGGEQLHAEWVRWQ